MPAITAGVDGWPVSDDTLRNWPWLVRKTPRERYLSVLALVDNQKRFVVPDWESSATCISAGLCIRMVPTHFAKPWLNGGKWVALKSWKTLSGFGTSSDMAAVICRLR
ncbi:LysR substrate-binding domain-containing protein [Escherichia coli]